MGQLIYLLSFLYIASAKSWDSSDLVLELAPSLDKYIDSIFTKYGLDIYDRKYDIVDSAEYYMNLQKFHENHKNFLAKQKDLNATVPLEFELNQKEIVDLFSKTLETSLQNLKDYFNIKFSDFNDTNDTESKKFKFSYRNECMDIDIKKLRNFNFDFIKTGEILDYADISVLSYLVKLNSDILPIIHDFLPIIYDSIAKLLNSFSVYNKNSLNSPVIYPIMFDLLTSFAMFQNLLEGSVIVFDFYFKEMIQFKTKFVKIMQKIDFDKIFETVSFMINDDVNLSVSLEDFRKSMIQLMPVLDEFYKIIAKNRVIITEKITQIFKIPNQWKLQSIDDFKTSVAEEKMTTNLYYKPQKYFSFILNDILRLGRIDNIFKFRNNVKTLFDAIYEIHQYIIEIDQKIISDAIDSITNLSYYTPRIPGILERIDDLFLDLSIFLKQLYFQLIPKSIKPFNSLREILNQENITTINFLSNFSSILNEISYLLPEIAASLPFFSATIESLDAIYIKIKKSLDFYVLSNQNNISDKTLQKSNVAQCVCEQMSLDKIIEFFSEILFV